MSIFPYPADSPAGLAARWVRWVASSGPRRNPVRDATGRYAHRHQPADVWFLAGSFGGTVERRCAVPAGRPLFFPTFNIWCPAARDIPPMPAAVGEAYVDGVPHPVAPIDASEPFDVRGAYGNPVTAQRSPVGMRVWGIWGRVDPLPPGPHTVYFAGTNGHRFQVAATYHLQVGPATSRR